jgi:hypothetical protein
MSAASKAFDMRSPCWYPFMNVSTYIRMYVYTYIIYHIINVLRVSEAQHQAVTTPFVFLDAFFFLGATSGAVTTPFDVLKTRIMTCTMDCAGGLVCGGGGMSRSGGGGVKVGV